MLVHILINLAPTDLATAFGGMYITNPSIGVIKSILALGTLIVLIQAKEWLSREDTAFKEGVRSEEHTSELQSRQCLVCRLVLEKNVRYRNEGVRYVLSEITQPHV